jgi:uncharacterized protein (TIGR03086 family)
VTFGDEASPAEILTRACESTRSILGNVTREELALPTPCADWPVRDLVNHIVGATRFFADIAGAEPAAEGKEWPSYADTDFVTAFGQHAHRAIAAFSAPAAMEQIMALPTGPAPGSRCIQVATGEIFVHGWDLARATGQPMPPGTEVADELLSSDWIQLCDEVRNGDPPVFAAEIDVRHDAPAIDRLAAYLGREPSWSGRP